MKRRVTATLALDQSAAARDRLLREMGFITSANLAACWVRGGLTTKNSLTAADAKTVEDAPSNVDCRSSRSPTRRSRRQTLPLVRHRRQPRAKPRLRQVLPKVISPTASTRASSRWPSHGAIATKHTFGLSPSRPAWCAGESPQIHTIFALCSHVRSAGRSATNSQPLCRGHHRAAHRAGDERAWSKAANIDPVKIARTLWKETRLHGSRKPRRVEEAAAPLPLSVSHSLKTNRLISLAKHLHFEPGHGRIISVWTAELCSTGSPSPRVRIPCRQ
jgi:hypothetical protein